METNSSSNSQVYGVEYLIVLMILYEYLNTAYPVFHIIKSGDINSFSNHWGEWINILNVFWEWQLSCAKTGK